MAEVRRALTARSLALSVLLGTHPPRLPVSRLVRAGLLFDVAEGTMRTALSRLAAAGELRADEGWYELTERHLDRQRRQDEARRPPPAPWSGRWSQVVIVAERRDADERSSFRRAMAGRRFAELREGVWLRPEGLDPPELDEGHLHQRVAVEDDRALARRLWDLDGWAGDGTDMVAELATLTPGVERREPAAVRAGFELSAAILRHLASDPLLPDELLPASWPGPTLRRAYDRFEATFQATLLTFLRGDP